MTLLLVILTLVVLTAWLLLDAQPLSTSAPVLNANAVKHSQKLINNLHQSIQRLLETDLSKAIDEDAVEVCLLHGPATNE